MPSFFVPTPGDLTAQESQPLMAYARGSAREGAAEGGGGGAECSWNSLMHIKKAESFFDTVACCFSPSKQKTENGEIDLWKHLYCYCLSFLRLKMKR